MVADLERTITTHEIDSAIKSTQTRKSSGPDRYPTEFFKRFSTQLSPLLLSVFEESFLSHFLPPTMSQAVISLTLKKDKEPLECSSCGPISLLNMDAKILAKVLALRLEKALPLIISPDHTDFIKNQHSFLNISCLQISFTIPHQLVFRGDSCLGCREGV